MEDSALLRVARTWDPPYGRVTLLIDGMEWATLRRGETYSAPIALGQHALTVLSPEGGRAEATFVAHVSDCLTYRSAPRGLRGYRGYHLYDPS